MKVWFETWRAKKKRDVITSRIAFCLLALVPTPALVSSLASSQTCFSQACAILFDRGLPVYIDVAVYVGKHG